MSRLFTLDCYVTLCAAAHTVYLHLRTYMLAQLRRCCAHFCSEPAAVVMGSPMSCHASVHMRATSFNLNAAVGPFSRTRVALEKQKRYRGSAQQQTSEQAVNPLVRASNIDKGSLHVVSVPIGNLKDFSLRALEVLRRVDYIVCTNRQATKYLLDLVDVDASGRLIHYRPRQHGGNAKLVEMLRGGRSMALVAPSGTPCIADEGNELVREMLAHSIRVTSVPGPCAVTAALSISGFASSDGSFYFGAYLPESQGARLRQLRFCSVMTCPCVFYEHPRRILQVLSDIAAVQPKRRVALVHELTKVHESLHADEAEKLVAYYAKGSAATLVSKGQLVLVLEAASVVEEVAAHGDTHREEYYYDQVVRQLDSAGGDAWGAAKIVASLLSVPSAVVLEGYKSWLRRLELQRRSDVKTSQEKRNDSAEEPCNPASEASSDEPQEAESESCDTSEKNKKRERMSKLRQRKRNNMIRRIELQQEKLRISMAPLLEVAQSATATNSRNQPQ